MCQILMDGCKLITSTWHHGCKCGIAYYLKMNYFDRVVIELQWVAPYIEFNSCDLSNNIRGVSMVN
jgi:hypothetical protein